LLTVCRLCDNCRTPTTYCARGNMREFRSYTTEQATVAFARQGVAIDQIYRALMVPREQVTKWCRRAIERDEIQMMPPESAEDKRTASLVELVGLRRKVDDLQALIAEYVKKETSWNLGFVGVCGLTKREACVVAVLAQRRGTVSKTSLHAALYGTFHDDETPDAKIVDVFVCKIRKKLAPFGVDISTVWGAGYSMTPEHAETLCEMAGLLPAADSPALVPA
jgi:hypothetical protein